jgi:type IV fimbrial biogenesis protein FimT
MKPTSQKGFSIYELMITLLIVGVLLTVGLPNLSDFTRNSRISSTANDLHSSFLLARSEAARAKSNVTICSSANSTAANANCDGGSFDAGWIIFVDLDGDINRNPANEPILRSHPAVDDAIDITTNAGAAYFSFAPTGLGRGDVIGAPSIANAVICDDRGNVVASGGSSAARYLTVLPIGRATILRDVNLITAAGGCP